MRAITCDGVGGPEVLRVNNEVDLPTLGQEQVLLKVEATAVNRADTL